MATLSTNILNQVFQEYLTEELNREATLISLLPKMPERKDRINWTVNVGGAMAAGVPISGDAPSTSYDNIVPAVLPINTNSFQSAFLVNLKEMAEAAEQVSPAELKNLLRALMASAVDEIMVAINKSLFYGNGTVKFGGVYGLNQAISTADYAGISSEIYPLWKSVELFHTSDGTANGTPKALDTDVMLKLDRMIREKGGRYNMLVTSPKVIEQYRKLFGTERQFQVTTPEGARRLIDLGFGQTAWNGTPMIDDIHCAYLKNPQAPDNMLEFDEGVIYFFRMEDMTFMTVPTEGSMAQSGIYTQMEPLAKTALYVTKFACGVIPQLQMRSRKHSGVIRGIRVS